MQAILLSGNYNIYRRVIALRFFPQAFWGSFDFRGTKKNNKNVDYKYIVSNQFEFKNNVIPISSKIRNLQNNYLHNNISIMHKKISIGYCEVCKKKTFFNIDAIYDKEGKTNWRETLRCQYCGFNNRERMIWNRIIDLQIERKSKVYVTERLTPFYLLLKHAFPQCVGSEYLIGLPKGERDRNGVLNEDIMELSFEDNSFDLVVCRDVLEHVHDYKKALEEICRVLKRDGFLIMSVPFKYDSYSDEVRTLYENGANHYLMNPEIHGNPIDESGSLVYTIPGWEMIDFMKNLFKEVKCEFYFSIEKGYLANYNGIPQSLFVARKTNGS